MFGTLQISSPPTALESLFGEAVRIVDASTSAVQPSPLTDNAVYQLFVVALFVVYGFVLMVHGGQTGIMLRLMFSPNTSTAITNCYQSGYISALRGYCFLGLLAFAITVVRTVVSSGAPIVEGIDPRWAVPLAALCSAALFSVGAAIVWAIGNLTERSEFTKALITISATAFALFGLVSTPFVLMCALASTTLTTILYAVFALLTVLTAATLSLKTLIFFAEQKISILFWFLYLCAVLALPVGVLTTLIVRAVIA